MSSGPVQVGLSLQGVGYGASLHAVGWDAPKASANRVSYAHAGVSEWYANGPLGVEQGFTIPRAPSGHPAGPLTLSMNLSGNAAANGSSALQPRSAVRSMTRSSRAASSQRVETNAALMAALRFQPERHGFVQW